MAIRKVDTYPIYQFSPKRGLFAFLGPADMYRISNVGSNPGNEGITVDHYITRKMVIKHMGGESENISRERYIDIFNNIFERIRNKIAG